MDKLMPCPFCGGAAVMENVTFKSPTQNRSAVVCENCGAYGGPALGALRELTEALAVLSWNNTRRLRMEIVEECRIVARDHVCDSRCKDEGLGTMCQYAIMEDIQNLKEPNEHNSP